MTAVLQSSPAVSTGAYCWRIDNYQHLASAPGVATESPWFEVQGIEDHSFCVCLFPGGYRANSDGKAADSVSCFVKVTSKLPVTFTFKAILQTYNPSFSLTREAEVRNVPAWGSSGITALVDKSAMAAASFVELRVIVTVLRGGPSVLLPAASTVQRESLDRNPLASDWGAFLDRSDTWSVTVSRMQLSSRLFQGYEAGGWRGGDWRAPDRALRALAGVRRDAAAQRHERVQERRDPHRRHGCASHAGVHSVSVRCYQG